ncbi:hypothetical protein ACLSZ3_10960, partial [Avibacterium gallinarum]
MRGQNVGVEVGMFAQAGPQTGVGLYVTVGGGGKKMDAERTIYHNSQSVSFGNAWGGNIGFNADSGSENYRQVTEQAGLFAEEGGYHVEANQVHLKGAAIASTNANNSELATNKLTAEHIQNYSSSQAMSGGLSYGFSHQEGHFEEKGTGKVVEAPNNQTADNLRWVE